MANFAYSPPTDFLKQLGKLADIGKVAPKMVNESMPIVEGKLIRAVAYHVGTGELQESIVSTKAKEVKGGHFAVARPTGVDEKGVRNMEKLAYLEYGTSKQAATPMLTAVTNDSEQPVQAKMHEVFRREMEEK